MTAQEAREITEENSKYIEDKLKTIFEKIKEKCIEGKDSISIDIPESNYNVYTKKLRDLDYDVTRNQNTTIYIISW